MLYEVITGMTFTALSSQDQQRFAQVYERYAEETAASLDRYQIDGLSVYRTAKASINNDGTVECRRTPSYNFV